MLGTGYRVLKIQPNNNNEQLVTSNKQPEPSAGESSSQVEIGSAAANFITASYV
jgi:hypothetical protein